MCHGRLILTVGLRSVGRGMVRITVGGASSGITTPSAVRTGSIAIAGIAAASSTPSVVGTAAPAPAPAVTSASTPATSAATVVVPLAVPLRAPVSAIILTIMGVRVIPITPPIMGGISTVGRVIIIALVPAFIPQIVSIAGSIATPSHWILPFTPHVTVHNSHEVTPKIANLSSAATIHFVDGIKGVPFGKHAHSIFDFHVKLISCTKPTRN